MADAVTTYAVLGWAWRNKEEIRGKLQGLWRWYRNKPTAAELPRKPILILGPGGVGKTTLSRILSGQTDWLLDSPWEYKESLDPETMPLKDDPKTFFLTMPGQNVRRDRGWNEIVSGIAAGDYRGVILVCSDGYHSLPQGQSHLSLKYESETQSKFMDRYLQESRLLELKLIEQLAVGVSLVRGKFWLMTVVAKQDL